MDELEGNAEEVEEDMQLVGASHPLRAEALGKIRPLEETLKELGQATCASSPFAVEKKDW